MNIYQILKSYNGLSFTEALEARDNYNTLRIYTISEYDIRFSLDGEKELVGDDLIVWFLSSTAADVQPDDLEVYLSRDEAKTAFNELSDGCTVDYNEEEDEINTKILSLDKMELEFYCVGYDDDSPHSWRCEVIDEYPIDMFALDFEKK